MGREEILRPARLVEGRRVLAGLVRWSGSVIYEEVSCEELSSLGVKSLETFFLRTETASKGI